MPEMPELEILAEGLRARVLNHKIERVAVHQSSVVKTFYPPMTSLVGQTFANIERRGKFLLFQLESGDYFVVQLMRSGWLSYRENGTDQNPLDAVSIGLDDGTALVVVERGSRRRANVHLVKELNAVPFLSGVGLEPFDENFTAERLFEYLQSERMQLKSFLIDQRFVAGLGNAYTDEILFDCGLSPFKITTTLTFQESQNLQKAIKKVLKEGIVKLAEIVGDRMLEKEEHCFMQIHGRPGQECPRCETAIAEIRYSDRSTHYCPECQSGGKVYADRRSGMQR
jgi:formamidopyrimidine-DNA glycosylase